MPVKKQISLVLASFGNWLKSLMMLARWLRAVTFATTVFESANILPLQPLEIAALIAGAVGTMFGCGEVVCVRLKALAEVAIMNEYNLINGCLKILKYSHVDMREKLRMENLLVALKMLLLVDEVYGHDGSAVFRMGQLEELLSHVQQACARGESSDRVKGLVDHVRRIKTEMIQGLNLSC